MIATTRYTADISAEPEPTLVMIPMRRRGPSGESPYHPSNDTPLKRELIDRMAAAQTEDEYRHYQQQYVKLLPPKGSQRLYLGSYARPGTDDDDGS